MQHRQIFWIVLILTGTICLVLLMIFVDAMWISNEQVSERASKNVNQFMTAILTIISLYVGSVLTKKDKDDQN